MRVEKAGQWETWMKITRKTKLTQRILNVGAAFVLVLSTVSAGLPFAFANKANAVGGTTICASGCDEISLQDAVTAANSGDTIEVMGDLTVGSQVTVNKSLTIEGNGHTVAANYAYTTNSNNSTIGILNTSDVTINNLVVDGVGGTNLHGINIYQSTNIQLNGVTSKNNDKSGVSINGSTVVVDNITTANNTWHGVNADKDGTVLTVNGTSAHTEAFADIYVDDTTRDVDVIDANQQYDISQSGLPGRDHDRIYTLKPNTPPCTADDTTFDTFNIGSVNGQNGWQSTGNYDQEVVYNTYGYTSFGCKSLRISNAVVNGSFGDQTFSYSVPNEAGEASAENGGLSGGTRQNHFEASWDIASTTGTYQPGLQITASPDRGDGARMGWVQVKDESDGLAVNIYDYNHDIENFVYYSNVASGLDRTVPHTIKLAIDFVDGVGNDVQKVYVDGNLVHTGTTWEDYFRDGENKPTRTVDSLLFRAAGDAAPATSGNGFLIDRVNIATSSDTERPAASFVTPSANGQAFAGDLDVGFQAGDNVGLKSMVVNIKDSENSAHLGSCGSKNSLGGTTNYTLNCTIDTTNFADGQYYLRAGATDVNNNNRTISRSVIFDNTKPDATFTTPTNGQVVPSSISVQGTATDATSDVKEVQYTVTKVTGIGGTYVSSVTTGTANYDDATDTFDFDVTGLGDGYYRLKVQVFDNAGNYRYKYIDVDVDSTKPVVTLNSPTSNVVNATDKLVIEATDNAGLSKVVANIYKDGTLYKPTQASVSGGETSYTHMVSLSMLPDGNYYVKYNALDKAGNLAQTKTFIFTVDSTAPTASITNPLNGSTVKGVVTLKGELIDDNPLNSYFRIEGPNSYLKTSLHTDGRTLHEYTWDTSGLNDGEYTIYFETRDQAGNKDGSRSNPGNSVAKMTVTVDNTAPDISVKDGYVGDLASKTFNTVSFKLYDAYKIDKLTLNGTEKDLSDSKFSDLNNVTIGKFGAVEGLNTLILYDVAGNMTTYQFTIDTTAPDASELISPLDGAIVSGNPTQKWSHGNPGDVDYYVYESYSDAALTNPVYTTNTSNTQRTVGGTQNITIWWRVQAVDKAGNKSAWSNAWQLIIDNTAPTVTLGDEQVVDNIITPSVSADDANNPLAYSWEPADEASASNVTISDPTSAAPSFTANANGTYSFLLTTTDPAGNATTKTFTFTYTAPSVPVTPLSNTVTNNGGVSGSSQPATTGNFTNVALNDGTNTDSASETAVLGAQTESDDKSKTATILGATATPEQSSDGRWNIAGLAWYWWLIIIAALAGAGWWFAAALRRRSES